MEYWSDHHLIGWVHLYAMASLQTENIHWPCGYHLPCTIYSVRRKQLNDLHLRLSVHADLPQRVLYLNL